MTTAAAATSVHHEPVSREHDKEHHRRHSTLGAHQEGRRGSCTLVEQRPPTPPLTEAGTPDEKAEVSPSAVKVQDGAASPGDTSPGGKPKDKSGVDAEGSVVVRSASTIRRSIVSQYRRDSLQATVINYAHAVGVDKSHFPKRASVRLLPVIDPRIHPLAARWDCFTMAALAFTAVVTPFEVAFLPAPTNWGEVGGLFVFNRLIDIIFIIDLVLQFFLMYPTADQNQGSRWVDSRREIVWNYLTGWFALDLFSIILTAIDFIVIVNGESGTGSDELEHLRILRALRALRLVKLVRLMRASRMLKRWETRLAINYSALALSTSCFGVVMVSHWFACIWALQTSFFDGEVLATDVSGNFTHFGRVSSWKGELEYCVLVDPADAEPQYVEAAEWKPPPFVCVDPWAMYCASLYWAVMTITSIGYGDVAATPRNAVEQLITAVLMLCGGFLWGQVIGTFCGVIATFDPHGAEFRRNMDDLNQYMSQRSLPHEMRRRLREYFHQTKHLQTTHAQQHLLRIMSPSLQGEVAWAANQRWLEKVGFLRHCSVEFKVELSLAISAKIFAPGEICPVGKLYIIHRGLALYGARVLTAGKVWGDDVILFNEENRSEYCARAMNYLECYSMSREAIFAIAADFPQSYAQIRRHSILMALKRRLLAAYRLKVVQRAIPPPDGIKGHKEGRGFSALLHSDKLAMESSSRSSVELDAPPNLTDKQRASSAHDRITRMHHAPLHAQPQDWADDEMSFVPPEASRTKFAAAGLATLISARHAGASEAEAAADPEALRSVSGDLQSLREEQKTLFNLVKQVQIDQRSQQQKLDRLLEMVQRLRPR